MIKNSYFAIAENDLQYLKDTLHLKYYNQMAVAAQQITEKYLKGFIEGYCDIPIDNVKLLMQTHHLRRLGEVANTKLNRTLNLKDLAYLKDFYFEAKYPGENFITVTEEEWEQCYEIMNAVFDAINEVRFENIKPVIE